MSKNKSWTWSSNTATRQLADDLWQLDIGFQDRRQVISAYLLTGSTELTLIESGPTSSLSNLQQAMQVIGYHLADVTNLLVTHIHLDHAGAAGVMAHQNPGLTVYAHPFGVPHMVDPAKLLASATRIYQDRMEMLWGDVMPVPEAQMIPFENGSLLNVSGRDLDIIFTPGHAWHHVAIFDAAAGDMFTGDVGGVRMPGCDYVCPPTPPPDLDPEVWLESLDAMARRQPERVCLTHFGAFDAAPEHFGQIGPHLAEFIEIAERDLASGSDSVTLEKHLQEKMVADIDSVNPDVVANYELATPAFMAAMGLSRYLTKRARQATE